MFFILVFGWDGTGYKRFFSSTPEQLESWTWATASEWLVSDVALTLYGMGVILIPTLVGMVYRWNRQDHPSMAPTGGFLSTIFISTFLKYYH